MAADKEARMKILEETIAGIENTYGILVIHKKYAPNDCIRRTLGHYIGQ